MALIAGKVLGAWDCSRGESFPAVCGVFTTHANPPATGEILMIPFPSIPWNGSGRYGLQARRKPPQKKGEAAGESSGHRFRSCRLTCAYHLARLGYGVTVFEAWRSWGGCSGWDSRIPLPKKDIGRRDRPDLELVSERKSMPAWRRPSMEDLKDYRRSSWLETQEQELGSRREARDMTGRIPQECEPGGGAPGKNGWR